MRIKNDDKLRTRRGARSYVNQRYPLVESFDRRTQYPNGETNDRNYGVMNWNRMSSRVG